MSKKKEKSFAQHVGTFFAYTQALVDDLLECGFKTLKKSSKKETKVDTSTWQGKVRYGAKKTANFLGSVGETFYEEYEEIKRKKSKK